MVGDDDLFSRSRISPFLMAAGGSCEREASLSEHSNHLI